MSDSMTHYRFPRIAALAIFTLVACSGEPPPPSVSLYLALHTGDIDQVKRHLYWNADINQPDVNGDLPLHVLARANRATIARELLRQGADPNAHNAAGQTPIEVALLHGKTLFAQLLLDHGAILDAQTMQTTLIDAGVSDRDAYAFLLAQGAQLNQLDTVGNAPLHRAIAAGQLNVVERLLANGADVNQPDGKGRLPLQLAHDSVSPDAAVIARLLARNGAQSAAPDSQP